MPAGPNVAALVRWRDEVEARPGEPMWVVRPDGLVGTIYTVDADLEDLAVCRACFADRYRFEMRPSSHPGVTRFDVVPKVERFVADEDTARQVAAILAHNRVHGTLRMATETRGERF